MVGSTPAEWIEAYEEPHRKVKEEAGSCDRFARGRKRRPIPRVQRCFVLDHMGRWRLLRTGCVRTGIPSKRKNPELQKFRVEPVRIEAPWAVCWFILLKSVSVPLCLSLHDSLFEPLSSSLCLRAHVFEPLLSVFLSFAVFLFISLHLSLFVSCCQHAPGLVLATHSCLPVLKPCMHLFIPTEVRWLRLPHNQSSASHGGGASVTSYRRCKNPWRFSRFALSKRTPATHRGSSH